MIGIILSILILTGINPRVAPDRMSTFTFSGGYGNRTGSNVVSGSIALRTNLVVHLSNSLEIGLDGGSSWKSVPDTTRGIRIFLDIALEGEYDTILPDQIISIALRVNGMTTFRICLNRLQDFIQYLQGLVYHGNRQGYSAHSIVIPDCYPAGLLR